MALARKVNDDIDALAARDLLDFRGKVLCFVINGVCRPVGKLEEPVELGAGGGSRDDVLAACWVSG